MSDSVLPGVPGLADPRAASSPEARERLGRADIDVESFRRGDPECFRAVMKRFGPMIRSVVRSYTTSLDDREDLYQEVSVRILTRRAHYRDWGALRGWVTRVTHNCCRDWCAARKTRESAMDRYAVQLVPHEESDALLDDPSRLLNCRRFLESLVRALDEMPPRQAEAFTLVHLKGQSPASAARIMNVSPATVRSNLRHARKKLRELLEEVRDDLS